MLAMSLPTRSTVARAPSNRIARSWKVSTKPTTMITPSSKRA
jgi:hypothetical protein